MGGVGAGAVGEELGCEAGPTPHFLLADLTEVKALLRSGDKRPQTCRSLRKGP